MTVARDRFLALRGCSSKMEHELAHIFRKICRSDITPFQFGVPGQRDQFFQLGRGIQLSQFRQDTGIERRVTLELLSGELRSNPDVSAMFPDQFSMLAPCQGANL